MATATEQSAQLQRNVSRFLAGVHAKTQRRLRQWLPPRGPGRDVAAALAEEVRRSTAFEAAVRARLARDLPKAFAQENPRAAIAMLLARERRYARAHVEAAASRAAHSVEREHIRRISPYGALWLLDPTIDNCETCIRMAGKVWPWEVIDAEPPPLHHRCGCYLKPAPVVVPEVDPVGPGEDGEPDDAPPPAAPPPRELVVTYADRAAEQVPVAEFEASQPRDRLGRWTDGSTAGSGFVGEAEAQRWAEGGKFGGIFYHGTNPDAAQAIRRGGLRPGADMNTAWVTSSEREAAAYSVGRAGAESANAVKVAVRLDRPFVIDRTREQPDDYLWQRLASVGVEEKVFWTDALARKGFDGIVYHRPGGGFTDVEVLRPGVARVIGEQVAEDDHWRTQARDPGGEGGGQWVRMGGMEPWRIPKDEYAPLLRRFSEYPETPEGKAEAMAAYEVMRGRERDWEASVGRAVSLGMLDPKTADDRGWYDAWQMKPIPDAPLWHVTTAKRAVLSSGGLKSRRELNQVAGHGLGAGDDTTVSFTANHQTAKDIERAMHEARAAARGEFTVAEMLDRAEKGTDADHGYASDLRKQLALDGLDQPVPRVRIYSLKKEGLDTTIGLADEADIRARGWEPLGKPVVGGDGISRYSNASRPASPEELHEKRLTAYKAFAAYRGFAGGPIDPLFMSVDATAIATMEPADIAILEGRPANPNVHGKWFDGLSEWRVYTGDAVKVTRVNDEPLQEAREHWFEQLREDDHWRSQLRDPGGEDGGQWVRMAGADVGMPKVKGTPSDDLPSPEVLRDTFTGPVGPATAEVGSVQYSEDGVSIFGVIEADGARVGEFLRHMVRRRNGDLVVGHANMKINSEWQRHGIATEFNKRAEKHYRQAGVKRVELFAAGSPGGTSYSGGYAWARAGYSFKPMPSHLVAPGYSAEERRDFTASSMLDSISTDIIVDRAPVSEALKRSFYKRKLTPPELEQMGRLRRGESQREHVSTEGKFHYEWEIASLGADEPYEKDGRTTWLGKEIMLQSSWSGVKELD